MFWKTIFVKKNKKNSKTKRKNKNIIKNPFEIRTFISIRKHILLWKSKLKETIKIVSLWTLVFINKIIVESQVKINFLYLKKSKLNF